MQNCKTCKYFNNYNNRDHGECHRYPPQGDLQTVIWMLNELKQDNEVVENELFETSTMWWSNPYVEEGSYCGEFVEASDHDILP
jgi:hypothetical protein